jgi:glutamate dehydrogenase (NAD(P)+)
VTVSYFEWVQNLQQFRWTADRVDSELQRIMTEAYESVSRTADEHDITLRTAAFVVAIKRVAAAVKLRGV